MKIINENLSIKAYPSEDGASYVIIYSHDRNE